MTSRPGLSLRLNIRRRRCFSDSSSLGKRKKPKNLNASRVKTAPNGGNSPVVDIKKIKIRKPDAVISPEDSPKRSDAKARPAGFLHYVCAPSGNLDEMFDDSAQSCDKLMHQYDLLKQSFPDFPKEMMKTLLVREHGNSRAVYDTLLDRGWVPYNRTLVSSLTTSRSDHFELSYYWGELQDSYLEYLRNANCGSYFTAIQLPCVYIICYLDEKRQIVQRQSNSPVILHSHRKLFSLVDPLTRPRSISKFSLVPFLSSYSELTLRQSPRHSPR